MNSISTIPPLQAGDQLQNKGTGEVVVVKEQIRSAPVSAWVDKFGDDDYPRTLVIKTEDGVTHLVGAEGKDIYDTGAWRVHRLGIFDTFRARDLNEDK